MNDSQFQSPPTAVLGTIASVGIALWISLCGTCCKAVNSSDYQRMFLILYNERKAAEIVAYLLSKGGGSLEILKLMKLVYLCERSSYEQYGEPLLGDQPYAFEHGPVLSKTFDLAKVNSSVKSAAWERLINPSQDYNVTLRNPGEFNSDSLMDVSDSDLALVDAIWAEFGHMTGNELRAYTHRELPEYSEPPMGKRAQINPHALLRAVGFSDDDARRYVHDLQAAARVKAAFGVTA